VNTLEAFRALDIRTGTIVEVEDFPEATKPLYKVMVDFGPKIGRRRSGAGLKPYYPVKEKLIGKKVAAVINLPPRQIVTFSSECLILAAFDEKNGTLALLTADQDVPDGLRIF
jgi:tRNA-binding protein